MVTANSQCIDVTWMLGSCMLQPTDKTLQTLYADRSMVSIDMPTDVSSQHD